MLKYKTLEGGAEMSKSEVLAEGFHVLTAF
jgi:hypothetical protein